MKRKKVVKGDLPERTVPKSKNDSKIRSLRSKLIISFLIPVCFIVALGGFSYRQVSRAMMKQYELTANDTMQASNNYFSMVTKNVVQHVIRIVSTSDYSTYFTNNHVSDLEKNASFRSVKVDLINSGVTVDALRSIVMIGKDRNPITNQNVKMDPTFFEQFLKTPEGKKLEEDKKFQDTWLGYHAFADEVMGLKKDSYGLAYIRKSSNGKTFVFADIDKAFIISMLNDMYLDGSKTALVSRDGREVYASKTVKKGEKNIFTELDCYKKAVEGAAETGYSYEKVHGEDYLFLYHKVGKTGAMLCNLIPKSRMVANANAIGKATIAFTLLAAIVAILIGAYISSGIGNTIKRILKTINQASEGDLTARFTTKRNDEFKVLAMRLSHMLENMQELIGEVSGVSSSVLGSATVLSKTSDTMLTCSKEVSEAVNEMATGAIKQVTEADICVRQMNELSNRIGDVVVETRRIDEVFEKTKNKVDNGIEVVNDLNKKSRATIKATSVITNGIERLESKSIEIEKIIQVITDISEQTDLLSLNASIEAARAGEAGKGFSIVAEEIRKLALKSMEAVNQISEVVGSIQEETKETANSARNAGQMIENQKEALANTIDAFETINVNMNKLVQHMSKIKEQVEAMETEKADTLDSIQDISAVSQQSAASAQQINATTQSQTEEMFELSGSADKMAKDASLLQNAIQKFTV
ncbi:methyl-accepting chemotaxis protein [[Clostridium] polysaccharolyticum]|uniref:methyl-accepting chemotaxis protein n=1 Tax=[Clostridium] polysaccharolyticum TaxID=29364 RepID=UPI00115F9C08|nr:methyl-accepting chemotaxis protein [[Clostridium] polysaccharolyticum]